MTYEKILLSTFHGCLHYCLILHVSVCLEGLRNIKKIFFLHRTLLWMRSFKSQFPSCLDEKTEAQNVLMTSVDKWRIFYYESNSIVNQCNLFSWVVFSSIKKMRSNYQLEISQSVHMKNVIIHKKCQKFWKFFSGKL